MVVFVDLDGDEDEPQNLHDERHLLSTTQLQKLRLDSRLSRPASLPADSEEDQRSPDVNKNGFSAALGCYPYVVAQYTKSKRCSAVFSPFMRSHAIY